ncbi:MAG TPA: aminotransferase class I/II-fold pyridoxal phosphate-dependent enzyme [Clostridiaceae bacterium]|jgi:cystathionine beta-lyase|nr:aminotransferase class I/II-fold pyridoxal phosphate-dependent enzyme [Clostridiaceae bacterium]
MYEGWTKEDICTHYGEDSDKYMGAVVPPIFQTTVFSRKNGNYGYVYTRINNPTTEIVENKIAALEGGEAAKCFSSGMAAITTAILQYTYAGSHVIAPKNIYPPAQVFLQDNLRKFGVEATFVDGTDVSEIEKNIRPNTSLIYLESPVSMIFKLQDLEQISSIAKSHGVVTVIDNTWATPIFQNPLKLGIDIVVHSASKYLGGHSDIIGGALISSKKIVDEITDNGRSFLGGVMDPHQSWLLLRGIRTLPLRMERHYQNAIKVAEFLEKHEKVKRVIYPGLKSHPQYELACRQMTGCSGLMSFVLDYSKEQIMRFVKKLRLFYECPSWGGYECLINAPGAGISKEVSERTGIPIGLVRISVGLENVETIIKDLDDALKIL